MNEKVKKFIKEFSVSKKQNESEQLLFNFEFGKFIIPNETEMYELREEEEDLVFTFSDLEGNESLIFIKMPYEDLTLSFFTSLERLINKDSKWYFNYIDFYICVWTNYVGITSDLSEFQAKLLDFIKEMENNEFKVKLFDFFVNNI